MRTRGRCAIGLVLAIVLGFLGAWAFNPDSGAVLHNALLWHIFGIVAEFGPFVLLVAVLIDAATTARGRRHTAS